MSSNICHIYIYICRTPQLVGNFEALRLIEAEEKRKNKAEKGKRREKLEKRKTNLQPPFSGCKLWGIFYYKTGQKCQKCTISAHEMRCAPYIYIDQQEEQEKTMKEILICQTAFTISFGASDVTTLIDN